MSSCVFVKSLNLSYLLTPYHTHNPKPSAGGWDTGCSHLCSSCCSQIHFIKFWVHFWVWSWFSMKIYPLWKPWVKSRLHWSQWSQISPWLFKIRTAGGLFFLVLHWWKRCFIIVFWRQIGNPVAVSMCYSALHLVYTLDNLIFLCS